MLKFPQHIERKIHFELKADQTSELEEKKRDLSRVLYYPKLISVNDWLSYKIHWLCLFSVVHNEDVWAHIGNGKISLNTMKHYLLKLAISLLVNISNVLPEIIALVLDRQTTPEAHYVAVFATYTADCALRFKLAFLAHSPLEDEMPQRLDGHICFWDFVLKVFEKALSNVVPLIDDNLVK